MSDRFCGFPVGLLGMILLPGRLITTTIRETSEKRRRQPPERVFEYAAGQRMRVTKPFQLPTVLSPRQSHSDRS